MSWVAGHIYAAKCTPTCALAMTLALPTNALHKINYRHQIYDTLCKINYCYQIFITLPALNYRQTTSCNVSFLPTPLTILQAIPC